MKLYNSSEVLKKTGTKSHQLRYWEETGKIVPVSRTPGMRYYSEEQLYEIMKLNKRPMEVAFVCVDCRANKNISIESVMKKLQESKDNMNTRLEALGINPALFIVDMMLDDIENTDLEKLIIKAKEGLVSKLYIASDIGFPTDLVKEYIKWFKYLGVEVIDLTEQEE